MMIASCVCVCVCVNRNRVIMCVPGQDGSRVIGERRRKD